MPPAPTRPEDILADHEDRTELGGLAIRKGTVAAFLANARRWSDPATPEPDRDALLASMRGAVPSLRALSLFEVLDLRDVELRALLLPHGMS